MQRYFNMSNFDLKFLYTEGPYNCSFLSWQEKVNKTSNVLVVAKTTAGYILGGYRSISCSGRVAGSTYKDPNSFIFSLTGDRVFYSKNSTSN